MQNENLENFQKLIKEKYGHLDIDAFIDKLAYDYSFEFIQLKLNPYNIMDKIEAEIFNENILNGLNQQIICRIITNIMKQEIAYSNQVIKKKGDRKTMHNNISNKMDLDDVSQPTIFAQSLVNINREANISNNILSSNFSNINYKFSHTSNLFNEKQHNIPIKINSNNMIINTFDDIAIKEYSINAKSSPAYLDGIKSYFIKVKEKIKQEHGLENLDQMNDTFVLMVTFKNSETCFESIVFIDPSKEWTKYKVNFEDAEHLKNDCIFYDGQIIVVQGRIQSNDFFPFRIIYGLPLINYNLLESSLVSYYKEPSAYLVNIAYGPFFTKDNIDITLFCRTLNDIASKDPHVLILGGPFLPSDNEVIRSQEIRFKTDKNNELSLNYIDFFQLLMEKIEEEFKVRKV